MNQTYRICSRCIMDTSDPEITFDERGFCNHCIAAEGFINPQLSSDDFQMPDLCNKIKNDGKNKPYDCIVGMSGGVDSSYVAVLVKKFGLRPLAVHCDTGWNLELAVNNIEQLLKKLDIDLHTFVVDWEEMRDLQLSFLKASVPNVDIPTDHAFLAVLFKMARRYGITYIITGSNHSTESILPQAWGYSSKDLVHLEGIQKKFGTLKLKKYPQMGWIKELYYKIFCGIRIVKILNQVPYEKEKVKQLLTEEYGWKNYPGKHCEGVFTSFFQSCYLLRKFGYDKRRAHLASLVASHQMTRQEALDEINHPPFSIEKIEEDKAYVCKKLRITPEEMDAFISAPNKSHLDYPSHAWLFMNLAFFWKWFSWIVPKNL